MIYTVTLNPSLDYVVTVDNFQTGKNQPYHFEQILPGGKGLNVSTVLNRLGVPNTAFGFIAGFTGEKIRTEIQNTGISRRIHPAGTRCFQDQFQAEIHRWNGNQWQRSRHSQRPDGTADEASVPAERRKCPGSCGSVPPSVPSDIYRQMMLVLADKSVDVVVDASGDALPQVLPLHPFLIKPNHQELGELFHRTFSSRADVVPYAESCRKWERATFLSPLRGRGSSSG